MGTTLIGADARVEARFREIIGALETEAGGAGATAKLHPIEDPNARPDRERDGEGAGDDRDASEREQRESDDDRRRSEDR